MITCFRAVTAIVSKTYSITFYPRNREMKIMYNPKSTKAEEFISHEEVIDTLNYAEKNKSKTNKILRYIQCKISE